MELIDGNPVVSYRVRFQARAEITETQAANVKDGNVIVWIVRSRCLPPQYHPTGKDSDDRYRFNIQSVESAVPLEGAAADAALAHVEHGSAQGYLNLGNPTHPQLFDAADYTDHDADYHRSRDLLAATGNLHDGETLHDALARLVAPAVAPEPEDELPFQPPAPRFDPGGNIEVVGSIYPHGPSADRQLVEQTFGPA